MTNRLIIILTISSSFYFFIACSKKGGKQTEEQIALNQTVNESGTGDSALNSIAGNSTMKQISTFPSKVILTGLNNHRLVSIYKTKQKNSSSENMVSKYSYYDNDNEDDSYIHFMPGIDILYGYNLLNIAHYDMKTERGNFLFSHPVLVKTIYYPTFIPDSLHKQPINRGYYLVSVYDEDTNNDTLINKKDLRRFYCFDSTGTSRIQLIPTDYSVIRSQYDSKNDVMYVFARQDENKNGAQDDIEPIHVFWFSLKTPDKAKMLY